jgi:hypothetical protein
MVSERYEIGRDRALQDATEAAERADDTMPGRHMVVLSDGGYYVRSVDGHVRAWERVMYITGRV